MHRLQTSTHPEVVTKTLRWQPLSEHPPMTVAVESLFGAA
jgi:hypothetical protein